MRLDKFFKNSRRCFLISLLLTSLIFSLVFLVGCQQETEVEKPEEVAEKPAEEVKEETQVSGLPPIEEGFKDCTYCHGSIDYGRVKEKEFARNLLYFTHVPHINIGTKCSVCHKLPVHVKEKVYRPPMHICYSESCHGLEKAKASGECKLCHPPLFDLKPGAGSQYGDHKTTNFLPPLHAELARGEAGENCDICHLNKFCFNCHGMEIPHTKEFATTKEHGQLAKKDMAACIKCHPSYDFCESCHHEGWTPTMGDWITKGHPVMVKEKGAKACDCHGGPFYTPFCAKCHVERFRK